MNGPAAATEADLIRFRVLEAIRPQLDYADRLIWELECPRIKPGRRAE